MVYGCFCTTTTEYNSCNGNRMAREVITTSPLTETFPASGLHDKPSPYLTTPLRRFSPKLKILLCCCALFVLGEEAHTRPHSMPQSAMSARTLFPSLYNASDTSTRTNANCIFRCLVLIITFLSCDLAPAGYENAHSRVRNPSFQRARSFESFDLSQKP